MLKDLCDGATFAPLSPKMIDSAEDADAHPESSAERGTPLKGLVWAMGLQAALALGVYGIWHILR